MEAIIVQETDRDVLDVLTQALELENYQVYALQDTNCDFIDIIEKMRPHVVILDFHLKGVVCVEIFKNIKDAYPHLPVIATSCNSNIDQIAGSVGFDAYIPKPFDLDHLYATIRRFVPKIKVPSLA